MTECVLGFREEIKTGPPGRGCAWELEVPSGVWNVLIWGINREIQARLLVDCD